MHHMKEELDVGGLESGTLMRSSMPVPWTCNVAYYLYRRIISKLQLRLGFLSGQRPLQKVGSKRTVNFFFSVPSLSAACPDLPPSRVHLFTLCIPIYVRRAIIYLCLSLQSVPIET